MAISLTGVGVLYPDSTEQTKGVGTRNLLATLTASNSAALSYTGFSSSYDNYELVFTSIIPVSNAVSARLRLYIGNAWATGTYYNSHFQNFNGNLSGAFHRIYGGNTDYMWMSNTNFMLNSLGHSGSTTIWNANSANLKRITGSSTGWQYAAGWYARDVLGATYTASTGVVQGFQYYMSSGNISSGTIRVYGYN